MTWAPSGYLVPVVERPSDESPPFSVESEDHGAARVVAVEGEVDVATADQFQQAMRRALAGDVKGIVVDLLGVGFSDARIVTPLLDALAEIDRRNGRMTAVCGGQYGIRQLFRVTGVGERIPLTGTREEALALVTRPA